MGNSILIYLLLLGAFVFALLGWHGYQTILANNECTMTYSARETYTTLYEWKSAGYKLVKVSNNNSKKLNNEPVLFIPGHLGSANQGRSFASYMHNEDKVLQYFALDFGNELMAIHGGSVLKMAAFTNEAVDFIKQLYAKSSLSNKDVKFTLLGHSYGGMIAKTSVILSNHPSCLVSSIVMLSSPTTKAPYTPDASLDALFHNINKAWYSQHYNNTCKERGDWGGSSTKSTPSPLSLQLTCAHCVRSVKLISITGGEIDYHVVPELSNVFDVSPRPRNVTYVPTKAAPSKSYTLTLYYRAKDSLRSTYPILLSYLSGMLSSSVSSSTNGTVSDGTANNSTVLANTTNITTTPVDSVNTTATPVVQTPPQPPMKTYSIHPASQYAYLSPELWNTSIIPYVEPQHISLRTTQLDAVGFPIDHYAILWCHQLVHVVNTGIKTLNKRTAGSSRLSAQELYDIFGGKRQTVLQDAAQEVEGLEIAQLTHFVIRNATNQLWLDSKQIDMLSMQRPLQENVYWYMTVEYVLHHAVGAILPYFYVWSMIAMATTMLNELAGRSCVYSRDTICGVNGELYGAIGKVLRDHSTVSNAVLVVVIAITAYYNLSSKVTLSMIRSLLIQVFYSMISLLLALGLRGAVLTMLFLCQWPIRKLARLMGIRSSSPSQQGQDLSETTSKQSIFYSTFLTLYNHPLEILFACFWTGYNILGTRYMGQGNSWQLLGYSFTVALYTVIVCAYGIFVVQYLLQSSKRQYTSSRALIRQELVLCYGSVLITAWPHFHFVVQFLLMESHPIFRATKIFDIFFNENFNYTLSLIMITVQLGHTIYYPAKQKIPKIKMLADLLKSEADRIICRSCFHEDGGEHAILEAVEVDSQCTQVVGKGTTVIIGCTHRVIWCDCSKNHTLKTFDEWCEWCKCENCGGKNGTFINRYQPPTPFAINLDGLVVLAMYAIAGILIYYSRQQQLYVILYAIAGVSTILLLRSFFTKHEITFS